MTVRELVELLQKVENQSLSVCVFNYDDREFAEDDKEAGQYDDIEDVTVSTNDEGETILELKH